MHFFIILCYATTLVRVLSAGGSSLAMVGAVNSVSQRVIFRGTDGTAAAAAQWRKVKRSHRSACCSPLLLCRAESPLTRPCLPFFHTEDSENLVGDKHRCTQRHTNACAIKVMSPFYSHLIVI